MLVLVEWTTVRLPDDVDRAMRDEAAPRGMTVSEWVREAIEAHLPVQHGRRRLRFIGAGRSGETDISERVEEILAADWSAAHDRGE
jgi:hypothetical protein